MQQPSQVLTFNSHFVTAWIRFTFTSFIYYFY